VERDAALVPAIAQALRRAPEQGRSRTHARLDAHRDFVEQRQSSGRAVTHVNQPYGFPVVTGQEEDLVFLEVTDLQSDGPDSFRATHAPTASQPASPRPGSDPGPGRPEQAQLFS